MRSSSTARARAAVPAPAVRTSRRGSAPPFSRSSRVTTTRSRVSAASALPSSVARSTWWTSRTVYGSSRTGVTKPGVPRRVVVSAAIAATTSGDG
ncbi:hypothetical protein STENM223S_03411 [Streptomyces tendae]